MQLLIIKNAHKKFSASTYIYLKRKKIHNRAKIAISFDLWRVSEEFTKKVIVIFLLVRDFFACASAAFITFSSLVK